jgi:hypothetical protein
MLVASAMRRTASNLNSLLYFLAFFPIGLPHYGRYVSPISRSPACLTFGVHYRLDVPIPDGNLVTTDHRVLFAVMLFIRIHVRSRFTQDYRPGAFSAVPFGTDP